MNPNTKVQYLKVTSAENGQKLIQFLQRRLKGNLPGSALMRWIRTGQVRLDKKRCKPFVRISKGQEIRIPPYEIFSDKLQNTDQEYTSSLLNFIYEDEQLAVLNKPQGLAVQPGSKHKDSVYTRLGQYYAQSTWMPGAVHRLDKDTSGLLLVAKTYEQLRYLHLLWRTGKIDKIYLAWVHGLVAYYDWVKIEDKLLSIKNAQAQEKIQVSSKGKTATALLKTITQRNHASLVAIKLITGRKHQIRVQLTSRGHPILGDLKYGKTKNASGLLLHAWHLSWKDYSFTLAPDWLDQDALLSAATILSSMPYEVNG